MSGRDDESCDIMRHHATPCDWERKRVGSGWRKTSFVRRRCGRGTRWRERERKAGGSRKRKQKTSGRRKRKGFPLQSVLNQAAMPRILQNSGINHLSPSILQSADIVVGAGVAIQFFFDQGQYHPNGVPRRSTRLSSHSSTLAQSSG